jgi:hypothetical protein
MLNSRSDRFVLGSGEMEVVQRRFDCFGAYRSLGWRLEWGEKDIWKVASETIPEDTFILIDHLYYPELGRYTRPAVRAACVSGSEGIVEDWQIELSVKKVIEPQSVRP